MERKLGEVFQDGDVTLKVELEDPDAEDVCNGCFYDKNNYCLKDSDREGFCTPNSRADGYSVIFVKQN